MGKTKENEKSKITSKLIINPEIYDPIQLINILIVEIYLKHKIIKDYANEKLKVINNRELTQNTIEGIEYQQIIVQ